MKLLRISCTKDSWMYGWINKDKNDSKTKNSIGKQWAHVNFKANAKFFK